MRIRRFFDSIFVMNSCAVALLAACGAPPAETPASAVADGTACDCPNHAPGDPGTSAQVGALPRYFTVELVGNQTLIGGQAVSGEQLSQRLQQEASDDANAGAFVRLGEGFSGEMLGALVWELSSIGVDHIVVARASDPIAPESEPVAAAALAPPVPESAPEPEEPLDPVPRDSSERVDRDAEEQLDRVSIRTIGLHVGGGPNDDATRAKFTAPIEKHFDAFKRCHRLAKERSRNASVGVDLLLRVRGGAAELRDFRSALSGEEFERCVRDVFAEVRFPRVERPTVISYSFLFEPKAP